MESYSTGDAAQALKEIAQAERETHLPSQLAFGGSSPLPVAHQVFRLASGVSALATSMWLMSRAAWWGLPAGLLVVVTFIAATMRFEQRHTKVRPKIVAPRHVFWESMKTMWPLFVAIVPLTPGVLWAVEAPRPFWVLALVAIAYTGAIIIVMGLLHRWRQRRAVSSDD